MRRKVDAKIEAAYRKLKNESIRQLRARRQAEGLCRCGGERRPGRMQCAKCVERDKKSKAVGYSSRYNRESRQYAESLGLCQKCKQREATIGKRCAECREADRDYYYKSKREGRCPACGGQTRGKSKCEACFEKAREHELDLRANFKCHKCHKEEKAPGKRQCNTCLAKRREYFRKRREADPTYSSRYRKRRTKKARRAA